MDPRDPLPPDPYAALGVPKDASQATIKTAYRKAALKCHPDKVPGKGDEFHRISVAYELIGEEESRSKYDADVRLRELKKEQQARFGGGPGMRSDARGSPRSGFQFSERPTPRYETSERRPSPQYASTPRGTPFERESSRGDYFGRYEAYDAPPPRKTSGTKPSPREEERKPNKKEKVDPKQKARDDVKKNRDKTRGYERKTKVESLVDSESESEYDNPRRPRQENVRAAYVRPKKESSRRSDDDDKDYFSRRHENMRTYNVKDYISKSKTEGPPMEKGGPPPAYATNGSRRQARSPSPSPPLRERERDEEIRSPKIRSSARGEPEVVRRSSDKPSNEKDKSSKKNSAKSTSARPAVSRMASGRRSPPPEREHRPTSRLQHADTAPASRLYIPEDAEIRRGKADTYRAEDPRVPPMRRSETVPKPSRHGDTTPIQSSGLRNMKTNDDSGYSTSSPSEDTPPQSTKQYRYDAEREERARPSMRDRRESNRSPERDTDRDRRIPSEKDRVRGPPVSRSGSYAFDARNSDPEQRPAQARRPSLQRRGSEQERRGSLRDDPPRRVPLERSDSMRGSSARVPQVVPDLPRGKTMPTIRTGFNDPWERSGSDPRLFNEIPHMSSPVNAHSDDSDFDELPSRMRRGAQRDIPHRHVFRDMDSGYGTGYGNGYGMHQGRRASEDYEKMRMDGAARYMEQATERPLPRRTATYAGMG